MQAFAKLNGSRTSSGNYVWGAALTLAWKNLCKQIIHEPIKVQSNNKKVKQIVDNFNSSTCSPGMINQQCYYAKTGFGNKTVHLINQQVAKKFPQKTTPKVQPNLQDDSIISYAYFFKKLKFAIPFSKKQVQFNGKSSEGFTAKKPQQKQQILVHNYTNDNDFLIQLKTTAKDDHIFVYKTQKDLTPEAVLQVIAPAKNGKGYLQHNDVFEIPNVTIKHNRSIQDLIGVFLQNPKFSQYFFAEIYEIINFDLDCEGVKVQNQGVIKMLRMGMPVQKRRFVLDKPFWIVMRQKNNHPYFVAHIANLK